VHHTVVEVLLNTDYLYKGILDAVDDHHNVVLLDCSVYTRRDCHAKRAEGSTEGDATEIPVRKAATVVVRASNIAYIRFVEPPPEFRRRLLKAAFEIRREQKQLKKAAKPATKKGPPAPKSVIAGDIDELLLSKKKPLKPRQSFVRRKRPLDS